MRLREVVVRLRVNGWWRGMLPLMLMLLLLLRLLLWWLLLLVWVW